MTVLSLVALVLGVSSSALAPPLRRGPPIQFSDPRNDTVSTNINVLNDRGNSSLRRVEEELRQPFRMLERDAAGGSSRMLGRPPAGPIIQSPKVRELLDKQKNWVFMSPEEQGIGLRSEEKLDAPQFDEEGRDKSRTSALDRYYENLIEGDAGATNRASESLVESQDSRDEVGSRQEFADPARKAAQAEVSNTEHGLRQLFEEDPSTRLLPDLNDAPVMPDLFDAKNANSWQTRARESRIEQFKQALQTDLPKASAPSWMGLPTVERTLGGGSLGASAWGNSAVISSPSPGLATLPGAGSFTSAGLAAAPSLPAASQPAYTPPAPVRTPPPSPFMEIPKRKF